MINLIQNPTTFETPPWTLSAGVQRITSVGQDDLISVLLANLKSTIGPVDRAGSMSSTFTVPELAVGDSVDFTGYLNRLSASESGVIVELLDSMAAVVASRTFTPAEISDYPTWTQYTFFTHVFDLDDVDATFTFRLRVPKRTSNGSDQYFVDNLVAEYDEEAAMARSTTRAFMDLLKTTIEGIDPNIGHVYTSKRRWKDLETFKQEAALALDEVGLFDDAGRLARNVTRFWLMSPKVTPHALTNCSYEYESQIVVTGFFQREVDDSQEVALTDASIEILDALTTKTAELTTLNTGDGYLGFLESPPRMLTEVTNVQLDELGIHGHMVQIEVTYFEEVSRI